MNILSWNICWGCMDETQNTHYIEAICKSLKNSGKTTCIQYMINTINELLNKQNLDFIALQEALRWEEIYEGLNNKTNIGIVHHFILNRNNIKVNLTTFYDYTKYKILGIKIGNICNNNNIRPYHIIFCKNKIINKYFIFINLHNGHNININKLELKLSENINKIINVENKYKKNFINLNIKNEINIETTKFFKKLNNINLIVAGDFNDFGLNNYWIKLKPFSNTNYDKLNNISVDTRGEQPPGTCCYGDISFSYGDYILTSNNLILKNQNYVPIIKRYPMSDHLPIMSSIEI
jgi:hypothetical protein